MTDLEKLEKMRDAILTLRKMYPSIVNQADDGVPFIPVNQADDNAWRRTLAYCRGFLWGALEILGFSEALNKLVYDEIALYYTDPSNQ